PAMEKLLGQMEFPEGYEGLRDKMILEMFYSTGMRRSELINLRETDVDFYQSQIKVLGKGNKERIIPLHPDLKNSIRRFVDNKKQLMPEQQENFLIVDDKGEKLKPQLVYQTVKKYL